MNALAENFLLAAAASQPQCAVLIDKKWSHTVLRNKLDRVTISECDEEIKEGHNGTQPDAEDWRVNFDFAPNRDGIQHEYAKAIECFLRALIDREKPAGKPVTELGHSQGGAKAFVSAFYKRRIGGMRSAGPHSYGGSMWAMDENCVPSGVRVTCGRDPVPCDRLSWLPFFRRIKRIPRIHLDGCPGARRLCILDHDYTVYARGIARWCALIGDSEGQRKMNELGEIVNQQWRVLQGI